MNNLLVGGQLTGLLAAWEMPAIIALAVVAVILLVVDILLLAKGKKKTATATAGADQPVNQQAQQENKPQQPLLQAGSQGARANPNVKAIPLRADDDDEDDYDGQPIAMLPPIAGEYLQDPKQKMEIYDDNGQIVELLKSVDYSKDVALVLKYNKSFMAKFIQAPDETKKRYTIIKNAIMSYLKTTSNVIWKYDSITIDKLCIAKFAITGKELSLYLALNPDEFDPKIIQVERTKTKMYADVPCRFRITSDQTVKNALELIAYLGRRLKLTREAAQNKRYFREYETTEKLVETGLIKEYFVRVKYTEFEKKWKKKQGNAPKK